MLKNKISLLALIFSLFVFSTNSFAQGSTYGQISGTVTDPNGAVVQGATVKIINQGTNAEQQTTTDGDGNFAFQLLPPGNYLVEVSGQGFQKHSATAVVNITQTTTVDLQLGLGIDAGSVTVDAGAPVLQSETSQNGRVIEGATIQQIPLPTRNFQQLLTLQSGAQSSVSTTRI